MIALLEKKLGQKEIPKIFIENCMKMKNFEIEKFRKCLPPENFQLNFQ